MPTPALHDQRPPQPPAQPPAQSGGPRPAPARPLNLSPGARTGVRAAIAIVAALAVLTALTAVAFGFAAGLRTHQETKTADLPADFSALTVTGLGANVSVRADDGARAPVARLTYTGSGSAPGIDIRSDKRGATVGVEGERGVIGSSSAQLEITVPAAMAASLPLSLDAKSGAVEVDGGAWKRIAGTAGSGVITVHTKADALELSASSGILNVKGEYGTADLRAKSGAIHSESLWVKRRASTQVSVGTANLDLSSGAPPQQGISATTDSGSTKLIVPRPGKDAKG
ncbi:hypothetical protein GSY69_05175 [Brevibacterium sp. 5221]|uniref:DUF4097 domain-containing protein n=1 Tax=Brevibacterium rongguiense TaxID=2695267 RepID=A0A6N9H651_9MICO|nr:MULTISPECIES: DUF4097 family beta strand repeat-containing protein [Brevibacterium]MYM19375.1 hypothetical protein [Brevibacterium rongguiense]WAL39329.1 hypothetical protein BRM1_08525 [Brevibacterium sp. BRM-1]